MPMRIAKAIALVGDFDPGVTAHVAIPRALGYACEKAGVSIGWRWVATETVGDARAALAGVGGLWVVPASPYRSAGGALSAIRFARENGIPFLGTCGGFQHALIEFARNVVGLGDADHAETNSEGQDLVVTRLSCSLVEQSGEISFTPGSQLEAIFQGRPTVEAYRCNYGPNPAYRRRFESAGLSFTGFDSVGEIRAGELPSHRFFIGTLFQPERSSLRGEAHPLIVSFVRAVAEAR